MICFNKIQLEMEHKVKCILYYLQFYMILYDF